jgi:hypothetical protein
MTKQKLLNNLTHLIVYIVSVVVSNLTYGFVTIFFFIIYSGNTEKSIHFFTLDTLLLTILILIINPLPLYLLLSFIVKRVKKHLRNKSKV